MNIIKTPDEIAKMRRGGKIAARVLEKLKELAKPGVTTKELDSVAEQMIIQAGARPSFKNFKGYPASTCISVNEEIVHGIPHERKLNEGDVVGIDVGVYLEGYHVDTAITVGVGQISKDAEKLIHVTKDSLDKGIAEIKPGRHLGDVQAVIQKNIEENGFSVIRDLSGHGVGRELQEEPSIPNFGCPGEGLILKEGMTLAFEPMVSAGDWRVEIFSDGWTVKMADGSLSAHFEHTIAVTKDGCEILTR